MTSTDSNPSSPRGKRQQSSRVLDGVNEFRAAQRLVVELLRVVGQIVPCFVLANSGNKAAFFRQLWSSFGGTITKSGAACKGIPKVGFDYCPAHDPARDHDRDRYGRRGDKRAGRGRPQTELEDIKTLFVSVKEI